MNLLRDLEWRYSGRMFCRSGLWMQLLRVGFTGKGFIKKRETRQRVGEVGWGGGKGGKEDAGGAVVPS